MSEDIKRGFILQNEILQKSMQSLILCDFPKHHKTI